VERYLCVIGVDQRGLVLAHFAGKMTSIPTAHFSLELLISSKIKNWTSRVLKWLERMANKRTIFTVIQDVDRANILMNENKISHEQIIFVPNAGLGEASGSRKNYLQKRFNISTDYTIVLHAGSINWGQMCIDLAKSAHLWHPRFLMVFHGRCRVAGSYADAFIRQIDNKRNFYDDKPISYSEMGNLIGSADVGVALYRRTDDINIHTMGKSSGKIAKYLQHGIPVVVSDKPSLRKYVEGYQCGICVSNIQDVGPALEQIMTNYTWYSQNALRCFQEEFNFRKHFASVLERLADLTGEKKHIRIQGRRG